MSLLRFCRSWSNRLVRVKVTFGHPDTGRGAMAVIIWSQASGSLGQQWVCSGLRHGGAGTTARTCLMKATGVRLSAFTAALTTATATSGMAIGAVDGKETRSVTTPL